jgi:hypothetical protein
VPPGPRLAPAQAIGDGAMKTARDRGESARMVGTIGEASRQLVADLIKTGDRWTMKSAACLRRRRHAIRTAAANCIERTAIGYADIKAYFRARSESC